MALSLSLSLFSFWMLLIWSFVFLFLTNTHRDRDRVPFILFFTVNNNWNLHDFAHNQAKYEKKEKFEARRENVHVFHLYVLFVAYFHILVYRFLSDLFCVCMILLLLLLLSFFFLSRLIEIRKYVVRVTQIVGHAYKFKHSN